MAEKHITVMVMSQPAARVSTYRFRRRTLVVLGILLVGLVGFSGFLALSYAQQRIRRADLRGLEERNLVLSQELAGIRASLAQYETQMDEHVRIEERLRLLANLDPIPAEARLMGVGGSEWYRAANALGLSEGEQSGLVGTSEKVDQLLRQARLQRESLGQVQDALLSDREKWARIPSIRPVDSGFLSSGFGRRVDPFTGKLAMHWGVDFCTWAGEPVYATADGNVVKAKTDGGLGKVVVIDHGNGYRTCYAHNSEIKVTRGQRVKRGDVVALVGRSGRATAPHLHYEVRLNGQALDPLGFILSPERDTD